MYSIGTCDHFLDLKRKYPTISFAYPRDWSIKEFGTLFCYDQILTTGARRVLEIGCGYNTFFAEQLHALGVDYWYIDRSNDYLGIGKNEDLFYQAVAKRKSCGATFIDGLLGENSASLPTESFDLLFSISVVEHIDNSAMPVILNECRRILKFGGLSVHSIDIYPQSKKASLWNTYSKAAGFIVPEPWYDRWDMDGAHTVFIEWPKIRFMIYNKLQCADPLHGSSVRYNSHFATMLSVAKKV